jgi:hypothetical protein
LLLSAVLDNVNLIDIVAFVFDTLFIIDDKITKKRCYQQKIHWKIPFFKLFLVISQPENRKNNK